MIQIFATDLSTNERFEITDLYWFEENGVHDFDREGHFHDFRFEIFIQGIQVYPPKPETGDLPKLTTFQP